MQLRCFHATALSVVGLQGPAVGAVEVAEVVAVAAAAAVVGVVVAVVEVGAAADNTQLYKKKVNTLTIFFQAQIKRITILPGLLCIGKLG